jgi:hypothetical protein
MNSIEQKALLKTNAGKSRTALATFLTSQPSLSYNNAMRGLKAAPRGNSAEGEFYLGQEAAMALLGKGG